MKTTNAIKGKESELRTKTLVAPSDTSKKNLRNFYPSKLTISKWNSFHSLDLHIQLSTFQVKHGLAIGADLDGLGEKWTGWTALHAAADNQQAHVVKWLLEQGADKNKITLDYSGYTALHLAVGKTNYEIVKLLLDAGADTEVYTASDGYTPLHIAAAMGNNCNIILIQLFTSYNFAATSFNFH